VPIDARSAPFVSVIVPVYNAQGTIRRGVESLLAQDYPSERYEVIVADNGSTDDTATIASAFPVRVIRADRAKGSYAARMTARDTPRGSSRVL